MRDESVDADPSEGVRPIAWFERLASAKLSFPIAVGFFALLAMVSAAATGVSYMVHQVLRH